MILIHIQTEATGEATEAVTLPFVVTMEKADSELPRNEETPGQ